MVRRAARLLKVDVTDEGSHEIARRSRGTPRIAGRLLRRVRDFAHASAPNRSTPKSPTARCPPRDRRAGPRRDGPALPDDDRRSLRRRTGRRRNACRGPERAARHDRGRDRAVSPFSSASSPGRHGGAASTAAATPTSALPHPQGARRACSTRRSKQVMRHVLIAAALLAAGFQPPRNPPAPAAPAITPGRQLAVPAGPRRRLLDAAPDDGAQPQRLRLGRPQQRRPRTRRSTASTSIRPYPPTRGSTATSAPGARERRGGLPVRAVRLGVPAVRADVPPDDARRGRRRRDRRD